MKDASDEGHDSTMPREQKMSRPVCSPVSESASANVMLIAAPIASGATYEKSYVRALDANARRKGAQVLKLTPSIKPTKPG